MKKNIIQFLVWMRNGIAFCTTWFLIIWLVCCHIFECQVISVSSLSKMLLLVIGGVLIFNVFFTHVFIKKWDFTKRLTCFIVLIGLYECVGFYWIGFFRGIGSLIQWGIFVAVVCALYFVCIAIYHGYSKKQGEIYTQALENYQRQRRNGDEK